MKHVLSLFTPFPLSIWAWQNIIFMEPFRQSPGVLNVGQLNAKLLEKIEELTLYLIGQQKELNDLHQQVHCLIRNKK